MAKGKKQVSSSESSEDTSSSSDSSSASSNSSSEESTSSSSESSDHRKSKKGSSKKTAPKKASKGKGKSTKKATKGKGKGKKSKKAKKDPNAPKKATSAYFYYTAQRREDLKKEKSTLSMVDQSKQFGVEWKALSDKEKEPYNALNVKDKKRYETAMANYKPPKRSASSSESDSDDSSSDDNKSKNKRKKQKKVKDPNAPKKALSAYMFFAADCRPKLKSNEPSLKPTEVLKRIGEEWGKLSEDQKKPYNKKADEDKVRFQKQTAAYKPTKK
jgi:hypothetical protein